MNTYQTLINNQEAVELINSPDVVFLDCRFNLNQPDWGRQSFMQSHIPGAYFLDINHDLSSPIIPNITGRHPLPNPLVLSTVLSQCGISENKQVIIYDQLNGSYASRAWWLLQWLGIKNSAVLNGGFEKWLTASYPTTNLWPQPKDTGWQGSANEAMIIQKDEIAGLNSTLIDSRDKKRFDGIEEPIDPIAGHIPGAVCYPFMDNLQTDGTWKPKEKLIERFSELTDLPTFYCGSGVTACHNILAYKIATGKMARLYPGSWSEWILYFAPA